MLLDEPSLGLSPKLVKDIFEIIVRINRERGVTILLVEQNANMALQTADFGYVLEVGRIVMADTCARCCRRKTSRNSTSASRTRARAASGAGRNARRGDDRAAIRESVMAGDGRIEVEGCDTIPSCSGTRCKSARRSHGLPREGPRHLAGERSLEARYGERAKSSRHGAGRASA